MTSTTETPVKKTSRPDPFAEAELTWELARLYKDLATVKGESLQDETEKLYLRGLLCGYSPEQIAGKVYRQPTSLTSYLSRTIYQYVKDLTGHEKMQNHSQIPNWLENYKKPRATRSLLKSQPEGSVPMEGRYHIERYFYFDKSKNIVTGDIHIHFETPLPETKEGGEEKKK
jgi:hypothetical protein